MKASIEVATTLYRKVASMEDGQNPFSNPPAVMEPLGIVGEVKLCHYSQSAANTCCLQRKNMIQV